MDYKLRKPIFYLTKNKAFLCSILKPFKAYYAAVFVGLIVQACCANTLLECPSIPPGQAVAAALSEARQAGVINLTTCLSDKWWEMFQDAQLNGFIEHTLMRNPTLEIAQANIELAATHAQLLKATLYPNLLWAADASRQKLSETGLIPFGVATPGVSGPARAQTAIPGGLGIPAYFTQFETEINLSYNLDLWGKNRNRWMSALNEVQAKAADAAFIRLELSIAVAKTYFQLQIDYERLALGQRFVNLYEHYVQMIDDRLTNGIDTETSLQIAKNHLSQARLSALAIEGEIAITENRLRAYLANEFNETIFPHLVSAKPLPKVPIPCDLPLHLVAHRPDIVAQLWQIESAGREIDVARAGFYPDVNINAFLGFQTLTLHKLFEWPSAFFNVDPAISLPLFDGGRLSANLQGREVDYRLAIADYKQLLLTAINEVLDGLALTQNARKRLQETRELVAEQQELWRLTALRAENHLSSDLDLIVSESQWLGARDQDLLMLNRTLQSVLALIKSVGGGYEACYTEG